MHVPSLRSIACLSLDRDAVVPLYLHRYVHRMRVEMMIPKCSDIDVFWHLYSAHERDSMMMMMRKPMLMSPYVYWSVACHTRCRVDDDDGKHDIVFAPGIREIFSLFCRSARHYPLIDYEWLERAIVYMLDMLSQGGDDVVHSMVMALLALSPRVIRHALLRRLPMPVHDMVSMIASSYPVEHSRSMALCVACTFGSIDTVNSLLSDGHSAVCVSQIIGKFGFQSRCTPLHVAAGVGDVDMMATLCKCRSVGPNIRDDVSEYRTPLHYACECGAVESVQYLVSHGGNVHAVDAVCDGDGDDYVSL